MRHGKYTKKLGVKTAHRKAMLSNLSNALITHGRIKTTVARAKEVQSSVEKLITLAKKGDLHSRRQAFAVLRNRDNVKKLFDEIGPEFKNTNGGYTRRAFFGRRLGDGASLSVIEINIEKKVEAEPKTKKGKKAETKTEAKSEEKPAKKKATKKVAKKKVAKKDKN
jgi:large subunit ribosomal protein L17